VSLCSKEDFSKSHQPLHRPLFIGGISDDLEVKGIGESSWTFVDDDSSKVQVVTVEYHVPPLMARMLSPQ